ncbi:MAG: glycosyltransferase [Meiothermus sp.]|nr:glycosyltransferase [Meiothermus sp.]
MVFLLLAAVVGWLAGSVLYMLSALNTIAPPALQEADPSRTLGYPGLRAVALTFDDGPDPVHTPEIAQVLREEGATATFFLRGEDALRHPGLVRDLSAQDLEIASRAFSRRTPADAPVWRERLELNATALVLASATGELPRLYRPDSGGAARPAPSGYLPAVDGWDAQDGGFGDTRAAQGRFDQQLDAGAVPQVLVLHHRENTPLLVRHIVRRLRAEGYQLLTLSQLMGLERAAVAAPVHLSSYAYFWVGVAGAVLRFTDTAWGRLMILTILVMTGRFVTLCLLCWLFARRRNRKLLENRPPWQGTVSVLIPAYNEKENIEGTIRSLMAGTRKPEEIIVINDGSKDGTAAVANRLSLFCEGRLRLLSVPNGGKAKALNHGIVESSGDVIICIDGDTVLDTRAVEKLIPYFANEQVGGVAGRVLPANNHSWLERFQTIEYLCGQDFEKRGMSVFNAVTVIPGAIGAWSRKALIKAGLYSHDTLVEDMDLTLAVIRNRHKIVYEPEAMAFSEAPQLHSQLLMQRFRWNYGILQCLWKYRRDFFNPFVGVLGWLVLPYQVFCLFIALVAALVYAFSLAATLINPTAIGHLWYWAVFLLVNVIYAALALWPHRKLRPLIWLTPVQQIYTSLLTAYILLKAGYTALSGVPTRWQKLIRTGSAQKMFQQS